MRNPSLNEAGKRAAGESAATLVKDGMVVGLGTGSTVAWTIRKIGDMVKEGMDIQGVATSYQSESLAISCGIQLTSLAQNPVLDLAIDGADQVDKKFFVIKGGGAAHTREKIVSHCARRFVVVCDQTKHVEQLTAPVPVEVIPFGSGLANRRLQEMGGRPVLRMGKMKDGPVITDNGNLIMDVDFGVIDDPGVLAARLSSIPGVLDHGIFCNLDELHLARSGAVEIIRKLGRS